MLMQMTAYPSMQPWIGKPYGFNLSYPSKCHTKLGPYNNYSSVYALLQVKSPYFDKLFSLIYDVAYFQHQLDLELLQASSQWIY